MRRRTPRRGTTPSRWRSGTPGSTSPRCGTRRCSTPGGAGLARYDWLHLHHEDFTGQYSKFYITYAGAPWLTEMVERNTAMARSLGFPNVPAEKRAVAEAISAYVAQGGFLFAMCAATETLDLALAGAGVDIAAAYADQTPMDPGATAKMDWSRALAFQNARLELSPTVSQFSDIDGHEVNALSRRQELGSFRVVQLQRQDRPRGHDAGAEPPRDHPRFLRADDLVPEEPDQAGRDDPGRRAGRPVGQVSSWGAWAGYLDLLRRPRPRGSAAPDRRRADRPVAAPAFAGVPADPEQRAVPGGEEEGTQDVTMTRRGRLLLGLLLFPCAAAAQAPRITPAGDPSVQSDSIYRLAVDPRDHPDESAVFLLDDGVIVVEADGRESRTFRQVVQVLKQSAVEGLAEHSFSWSPDNERFTLNWIRVVRPDGSVVSAGPAQQQESDVPAAMGAPVYANRKVLRVSLSGVAVGTIVDYSTTTVKTRAWVPGDFYQWWGVSTGLSVQRSRLIVDAPASEAIRIKERNLDFARQTTRAGDRQVLTWATGGLKQVESEAYAADSNDIYMSVALSSPLTWGDIGRWYGGLAADRYALPPDLAARVRAMVSGARSARDTAAVVQRWVAQDIRYVSIALGIGGYQPRTPAEVVASGFGDCKDKATLFVAALRLLGFDAVTVLASSSGGVDRALPSMEQFDHAIAYVSLPEGTGLHRPHGGPAPARPASAGAAGGIRPGGAGQGRGRGTHLPAGDPGRATLAHRVERQARRRRQVSRGLCRGDDRLPAVGAAGRVRDADGLGGPREFRTAHRAGVVPGRQGRQPPHVQRPRPLRAGAGVADGAGRPGAPAVGRQLDPGESGREHREVHRRRRRTGSGAGAALPDRRREGLRPGRERDQGPDRPAAGLAAAAPPSVHATSVFGEYWGTYAFADGTLEITRRIVGTRGIFPPSRLGDLVAWFRAMGEDDAPFILIDPAPAP